MNQGGDILRPVQVAVNLHQELQVVFLLLPSYHTLRGQAAMMNRDRRGRQKGFLVKHKAVDLLGQAGALLLSGGVEHRSVAVESIVARSGGSVKVAQIIELPADGIFNPELCILISLVCQVLQDADIIPRARRLVGHRGSSELS